MTVAPVQAVALAPTLLPGLDGAGPAAPAPAGGFARLLTEGLSDVERKLAEADAAVQAFALDDSVPLHQVTFALEEARLSLELALQVRSRLVEGYQELMRMQL